MDFNLIFNIIDKILNSRMVTLEKQFVLEKTIFEHDYEFFSCYELPELYYLAI